MIDVVWDMETSDPDDYLTLLLLLDHPEVRLKAVTITPGTAHQVGLVRRTLSEFDLEIPVGAHDIAHPKKCVSKWHEKIYGEILPSTDADDAATVLSENCDAATTLVTGAALKNVGQAIRRSLGYRPADFWCVRCIALVTLRTSRIRSHQRCHYRAAEVHNTYRERLRASNVGVVSANAWPAGCSAKH